ncbi:aromatic ring-hydroxylating dioxygenase subunit alpha [Paraburkholderia adhaesiva]|uniref:aromatic ring-hydroxylating dioxygenase subunit alpha n=1 Tax=Paraburkholderia adhaesiva TaxID=2883244 RepID=UPI001F1E5121|nr:aromatic ring-hydroxylating dioxygenase subunit alpha [Paraburkholderia adhaesiva]
MAFLQNAWYCVGWSSDLADKPKSIKVLGKELLLYRCADGTAVAVSNVCPHRFAPLDCGRIVDDQIECPYHGLRFDRTGACSLNPHGSGTIAPNARLQSWPLVERAGALWAWMGDPALADENEIVQYDYVTDSSWTGFTGYLHLDVDYQVVVDNQLDLTHSTYLHAKTVGAPRQETAEGRDRREYRFHTADGIIHSDAVRRDTPPAPIFRLFQDRPLGDIHAPMSLYLPSNLILDIATTDPGAPKSSGSRLPSAHFITPETETSCHYFFAFFRNERIEDARITARMEELVRHAFVEEDAPMIQKCFDRMGGKDLFELKPVILETDAAAVYARRALAKLIRDEQLKNADA